ncbi:hypothetical protein NQ318_019897 [Aromia moschata]|uniref:Uncharacterized protein n=1 Tax=Aromia moschata TaxID=1265417 RepID=A0AAV8XI96_9CUCU|nr:hypothetical protein NQ318_019897 [Aromia moschata]
MLKVVLFVLLFHSGICLQDVENTATETVQSETLAENPIVAEIKSEETALPVDNADSSSITEVLNLHQKRAYTLASANRSIS